MTVRVGITGFGRIGRCVLRAWADSNRTDVEIVALNYRKNTEEKLHLLKYDSTHGTFRGDIHADGDNFFVNGKPLKIFHGHTPEEINWVDAGVDVVLECTGVFRDKAGAGGHLKGGAKKVLVSAPSPDADSTIVFGVNNQAAKPSDTVISVGSCTTNCLAPVAKVLNDGVGIETGFMTTVHAYTSDQNLLDNGHKDLRRARSAGLSMIPTSTGAAKALGLVLPELKGKLDGVAVRVPTPNVSLVDLTFVAKRETTKEEIHQLIRSAANGSMKGVLGVCDEPLVSCDFNGNPHSSIFDESQTYVQNGTLVRVAAWYDNEWGFSNRMLDVAALVG